MGTQVLRIDAALGQSFELEKDTTLESRLAELIQLFNTTKTRSGKVLVGKPKRGTPIHAASFPAAESRALGALTNDVFAGAITLGYKSSDFSQSAIDQLDVASTTTWQEQLLNQAQPFISDECNKSAYPDPGLVAAFGEYDIGNPPEPHFTPVYFEVPRIPNATGSADKIRIFARLAFHGSTSSPSTETPPSAPTQYPTIIIIPGLFDSGSQNYVRNTAAVIYSLGYNVVVADMRDHGLTRLASPGVSPTLGLFEGHDILEIARQLSTMCGSNVGSVGAVGFSFGGTAVVEAALLDKESGAGPFALTGGALAISPPLDVAATMAWFEDYAERDARGLGKPANRGAIAVYFADLIAARQSSPSPNRPHRAKDYLESTLREAQYGLTYDDVVSERTLHTLQNRVQKVSRSTVDNPQLIIIEAKDDPVVMRRGTDANGKITKKEWGSAIQHLNQASWVQVYEVDRGGHMGFAAVSQPLSRCFLRAFLYAWASPKPADADCRFTGRAP